MAFWLPGAGRVFALAIALALAEYARGHVLTGLPWNLIGYGLLATLPLMQLAALLGVYALSLLAVLLFASPAAMWRRQARASAAAKERRCSPALLVALLGLGYGGASAGLAAADIDSTGLRLRIVQANVDQAEKWRPGEQRRDLHRLSRSHQVRAVSTASTS